MAKPPPSPPQKHPADGKHPQPDGSDGAAEQQEVARRHSAGRPPGHTQ